MSEKRKSGIYILTNPLHGQKNTYWTTMRLHPSPTRTTRTQWTRFSCWSTVSRSISCTSRSWLGAGLISRACCCFWVRRVAFKKIFKQYHNMTDSEWEFKRGTSVPSFRKTCSLVKPLWKIGRVTLEYVLWLREHFLTALLFCLA